MIALYMAHTPRILGILPQSGRLGKVLRVIVWPLGKQSTVAVCSLGYLLNPIGPWVKVDTFTMYFGIIIIPLS